MRRYSNQCLLALAVLTLILIVVVVVPVPRFLYRLEQDEIHKNYVICTNESVIATEGISYMNLRESLIKVTKALTKAKSHVRGLKTDSYLRAALVEMNSVMDIVQIRPEDFQTLEENKPKSICPEVYKGPYYGKPLYYTGFETEKCSFNKALSSILTIVLPNCDIKSNSEWRVYHYIINQISLLYGNVSIILGVKSTNNFFDKFKQLPNFVKLELFPNSATVGSMLNSHLKKVRTNFTLIARDLTHLTNDSRLERLIREIERLNTAVAGGASRDQNGHWRPGCYQRGFRNFTFELIDGYDESLHECMFCDHIDSPFIIKTDVAKKIVFDKNITDLGVYEDFFMRISQSGYSTVVCPDSMFYVNRTLYRNENSWRSFARKWNIHNMRISHDIEIHFSCDDFKSSRLCDKTAGYALHPCCLEELSNLIKFVLQYCDSHNISCELQEGTLLGTLKFGKVLPWELDADLTFLSANYSALLKIAPLARKAGYQLNAGKKPKCCTNNKTSGGEMFISSRNWELEMYGIYMTDDVQLQENNMIPTRMLFDGQWVKVPRNPGLHSRNRYGHEIYAHSSHWRHLGKKHGFTAYKPRKFIKCKTQNRHDCLDQFNGDGNIQFFKVIP